MGLRGPPKKPTELKVVQGNPGRVKNLGVNEPKPKKVQGARPPKWMSPAARRVWREMAPRLELLGLLTVLDVNMLARYCDVFVKWALERDFLDKHGSTYQVFYEPTEEDLALGVEPRLKYTAQYPAANLYHQFGKELTRLETQFGMSPASRASVKVIMPEDKKKEIKGKLYG